MNDNENGIYKELHHLRQEFLNQNTEEDSRGNSRMNASRYGKQKEKLLSDDEPEAEL